MLFPIESNDVGDGPPEQHVHRTRRHLALLGIGFGIVHWGKAIMDDVELADERHPIGGSPETPAAAAKVFSDSDEESGFTRRSVIRNSLIGALIAFPLPAVVLFRGFAPAGPAARRAPHTMWAKGTRLALDPSGVPIKASDVTIGSAFHIIPEGLAELEHGKLEEKAKAAVLLMRLEPSELNQAPDRESWSYDGIVAYSKICTHVGCPVALYEQHTHHLLCPCHQSQFDVANHCEVIFGPAKRPSAAADRRRRGLPHRAERLHRTRRPELLGAQLSTATSTQVTRSGRSRLPHVYVNERTSLAGSSRSSAVRRSPTTGRSSSARSRSSASSSS